MLTQAWRLRDGGKRMVFSSHGYEGEVIMQKPEGNVPWASWELSKGGAVVMSGGKQRFHLALYACEEALFEALQLLS